MTLDMRTTIGLFGVCALIGMAGLAARPRATSPSHAAPTPTHPASTQTQSSSAPTFGRDVAPIIYQHCASCHHAEPSGGMAGSTPFPLLTYEDVSRRGADIAKVTRSRSMPPWLPEPGYGDFAGENRLSELQIRTISEWVRAGAPKGPASEIPAAPVFADGWQLGKPDLILESARALSVPASGNDVFWNFIFSPALKT